jgi:hypothetical protein
MVKNDVCSNTPKLRAVPARRQATAQAAAQAEKQASASSSEAETEATTEALKQERLKSNALEEENKALRGQVATVLSYLDQVMPMDGEKQ